MTIDNVLMGKLNPTHSLTFPYNSVKPQLIWVKSEDDIDEVFFGMSAINCLDIIEFSSISKTIGHAYELYKMHSNSTQATVSGRKSSQCLEFLARRGFQTPAALTVLNMST